MGESLLSVGLDVGTTTTQMVVSRIFIENKAGSFTVPELAITDRQLLYKSPVYFTPLVSGELVDGEKLRGIVAEEYRSAGITRQQVDTGAVIITGETSRKENAQMVASALSEYAGDFVVATAGPDLESVLAARGAGAVEDSARRGGRVLHMDIGGGTSNLALIEDGKIIATGCLNVGGRLLKFDDRGRVSYISPVVEGLCDAQLGQPYGPEPLAKLLAQGLEMAAGLRPAGELLSKLTTKGTAMKPPQGEVAISFSGGVADCIEENHPALQFGDMGPALGKAIRESLLCRGDYRLGQQTIRATVIGAGSYSAQLSGSTVFYRGITFPVKNLPVIPVGNVTREEIRRQISLFDGDGVLFLQELPTASYQAVAHMAEEIVGALAGRPVLVAMEGDLAKALGQAIALRTEGAVLSLDGVRLRQGDYLDVAAPVGPALPVIIKTLIFER